jgi:uncharacterized membrane protein YphA (DoxX/SURF4 family)
MKTITAGSMPKRNLIAHLVFLRWLKKSTLIEIIAILYMSMFLYTAISKWTDYTMTREQMALMPLLTPVAHIVVWLLPATEIVITLLIFFHQTRKTGFYAATILMVLFTLYIIYMMLFYPTLPCSCGGFLTELSWPGHLVFNVVFIAFGILAIRMQKKINSLVQHKN